ncbi:zinc dependent phospholipase C family protein [Paenactinomyces guangxiensis]|uniref:Zinc dependent phospholipase C family protein n=1 Tax=Paenactinomyces guangxiensis TaxID=1490290 RepID=A0A7W1WN27_9BACL|nr:zinc dependent phospholipase C family protein [Paenactinomyces guangxiensis]MBA4492734.1 zinc dependent phospholipase C family protein [Paenactinomyces guangxiensis]MBH8590417.1 zinc dependent phospholipase C family protein [Paenactinomyces guangxiensis]
MPYAWTHILFGNHVIKQANLPEPQNRPFFQLGCQGPDFLFFHRFWPWIKDDRVSRLGDLFHTCHCGPVLMDLIDAAKSVPTLQDYVAGFVTHHILDRTAHPYIHYRAGYQKFKHQRLEVAIDTLVAKNLKNIEVWRTSVVPEIDIGHELPPELAETLHQVSCKYYPEAAGELQPHEYSAAYRDMKKALRLFFDPWGIKWLLTLGKIQPFRHSKRIPSRDFLNINQNMWTHPAVPEETHNESFWDLWEMAVAEGKSILTNVYHYWENGGKETRETLAEQIGDRSYDTGKDCSLNLVNRLSDPLV